MKPSNIFRRSPKSMTSRVNSDSRKMRLGSILRLPIVRAVGAVVGFLLAAPSKGSQLALATNVRQVKRFNALQKESSANTEFHKIGFTAMQAA